MTNRVILRHLYCTTVLLTALTAPGVAASQAQTTSNYDRFLNHQ